MRKILFFLLTAAASAHAGQTVLFEQPSLNGIAGRLLVQKHFPENTFGFISWQKSPWTKDGSFVPVSASVADKTGLVLTGEARTQQMGMRDCPGATTAQMVGKAVGVYLNSADLSQGGKDSEGNPLPGSGGYKMMVTPQIYFPLAKMLKPFATPGSRLAISFDLQVPTAQDAKRKGSHSYVNPCIVLRDPNTKLKISYLIIAFSNGYRNTGEHIGYDGPSHSWMLACFMSPGQKWVTLAPDSAVYSSETWRGWRHYSFAITSHNLQSALARLAKEKPDVPCSQNLSDYILESFHLNAELTYNTAPAELGWSMQNAIITLDQQ